MSVIYKGGKYYGGPSFPDGGAKGQVLTKNSHLDGDVVWATPGIETSPEMEGADYWHDGEKGLVPKPLKSDVGKCLFGDGEWRNIYFSDAGSTVVVSTKVEELLGQTCTLRDFRSVETETFVRNGDNIECVFQNIQMIGQCECTATDTNNNEYHGWVNMSYFGMYLVKFSEEYATVHLVADDPSLEGQAVGIYTGTNYSTKLFDVILMSDGEGGCKATFDLDATGDYLAQVKENEPSGKGLCRAPFTVSALNTEQSVPIFFYHLYGWKITFDSDPYNCVSYYKDPVWGGENIGFTPAKMNSTTGRFEYGSWKTDKFTPFFWPKPCLLGFDGQVIKYLNPDDLEKDVQNVPVDITSLGVNGNVMVEFPTVYFKRWTTGATMTDDYTTGGTGVCYCLISDHPLDNDFKAYAHCDVNGKVLPYIYLSAFHLCADDNGRARSLKGKVDINTGSSGSNFDPVSGKLMNGVRLDTAITYIQANNVNSVPGNGEGWFLLHWADRMMVNDLLILMGKSLNSQAIFGNGKTQNGRNDISTGLLSNRGSFYGITGANYSYPVKVFNIESWWGLYYTVLSGILVGRKENGASSFYIFVKMTYDTSDGSNVNGFNYFDQSLYDSRYIRTIPTFPGNDYFYGRSSYLSYRYYCELGMLFYPKSNQGNVTTYFCDLYSVNGSFGNTGKISCGGAFNSAEHAGMFTMSAQSATGVPLPVYYSECYMMSYKGMVNS